MSQPAEEQAAAEAEREHPVELADILREHLEAYQQRHHLSSAQAKAACAIMDCRTPALGGQREWCEECGCYERYVYRSCGNRHCPKCQSLSRARWLEERRRELLPVPYFHAVFTLPHELHAVLLWTEHNRRALLDLLFESASRTLLQFGETKLGGKLGITMVLHTWDQVLRPHFHVHCVLPGGALADKGERWVGSRPGFLFPVMAMSQVYRGKYLAGLQRLIEEQKLALPPQLERLREPGALKSWLRGLRKKSWVVYLKPPFAGPEQVLTYLGRYTHRVAISNRRILHADETEVRFSYRDRRDGDRKKVASVTPEEFIHRFLSHVQQDSFMRIRYYGFLASRAKGENLAKCRKLLGVTLSAEQESRTLAQRISELTGRDMSCCPHCGAPLRHIEVPAQKVWRSPGSSEGRRLARAETLSSATPDTS